MGDRSLVASGLCRHHLLATTTADLLHSYSETVHGFREVRSYPELVTTTIVNVQIGRMTRTCCSAATDAGFREILVLAGGIG